MSRLACVLVEAFVAAAVERTEPALRDRPLAIVTGAPPARQVIEANAVAREGGVCAGLTEGEATRRCPDLVRRAGSVDVVAAAHRALLDACYGVSPRVEDLEPGRVLVDGAGLGHLVGSGLALAEQLARAALAVGLPARVGVADTRRAAAVVARVGPRLHVVPPGGDAVALGGIAVADLDWPPPVASTLARWGVTTLGELAALPRAGLAARLGAAGLEAHDIACARDDRPFHAWTPPPFWEEAQELQWEIEALDPLVAVLGRVLQRLTVRLSAAHLAADALEVRLALAGGGHHVRTLNLACPMDEPGPMLALLGHALAAHPPAAAVTAVALQAQPVSRRPVTGVLGRLPSPGLRDLAAILARLTTLVGADNVGAVQVADCHRPDVLLPVRLEIEGAPERAEETVVSPGDGTLVLRRLRPPRRVTVETDDQRRPVVVRGALSDVARVVRGAGPWRTSGQWWDAGAWARDEWDVALTDRSLCRLVQDRVTGEWYLDGVYD